jgi:hypothetical protein
MKNEKIARIVKGLRNLERMRKEIALVISGVGGRLAKRGLLPVTIKGSEGLKRVNELIGTSGMLVIEGDGAEWWFSADAQDYFLQCQAVNQKCPIPSLIFSSTWKHRHEDIAMENVEKVYDNLEALVNGLVAKFPDILQDVDLIVRLADKFD